MSDWQPIETAPKDGTSVLIYGGNPLGPLIARSWGGSVWSDGSFPGVTDPTHWQPLPEPPEDGMTKRSADEWLAQPEYQGVIVMDPDGWDRSNYEESWSERIDQKEFERRLGRSTSSWRRRTA